ncbi:BamA/OMP85 family outer membrane protein [Fodinibius saliphilus]|uniref:BamA/OMP85 family outer membrane protein n=1 Tax=Fodinibius saliphilus TaxID=1920650 RepID=UPI0011093F20|nr:BamA/TamA family outer membrane protein [Fodinibius saliphilus]
MGSRFFFFFLMGFVGISFLPIPQAVAQEAGIPDQVWKVRFEGNDQYSAMVLSEQIATEQPTFWEKLSFWDQTGYAIDERKIKKDVIRLQNYYRRRGFVNVQVSYRIKEEGKSWKKKVVFEIDEQLPIRIQSVRYKFEAKRTEIAEIQKDKSFQRVKERQAYRKGRRYETIREPEVIGTFTDVFKNLGFAYAQVSVEAKVDTSKLSAYLTIKGDLGPRTYINNISVEGAESISEKYILREGDLKKGERYSLKKLRTAQKELFNNHLFRFVTISIPEQQKDSTLDLQMRVREHDLRSVELMAGFGTEEYLRGQVSWKHRNVARRGHRLTATAHGSFIEQSLRLDYLFPYLYNTKSSVAISPFGQHLLQNNYELLRAGITNSLIYRYTENLTASGSYEFTKNKELSQRLDSSLPDTTLEYDLSSFQFSGYYNQTLGREQEGWVFQPYLELSGLFGLATFQFQKLSADIRRFTRLSNTTMLATRLQGGALYNVPSDSLPKNIRFYLGGTNSVRGWHRQQLGPKRAQTDSTGFKKYIPRGGRAMVSFNIEVRQELNFFVDGLGIAFFLDGGQVWHTFHRTNTRPIQFGAGGGLRYKSPVGPIRIDVGYKINPTDEDLNRYNGQDFGSAWDRIGIHLSIGQAF